RHAGYMAFVEGWDYYVEGPDKEVEGATAVGRASMADSKMRGGATCRVVFDTPCIGLARGWGTIFTNIPPDTSPAFKPRLTAISHCRGTALAYKLGQLEILDCAPKHGRNWETTFAHSTTRCSQAVPCR